MRYKTVFRISIKKYTRTDCNICSDLTDKLHMDIFQVAAELIGSWPELQSFICKGDIQTLDDYVKENKIDLKTVRFDVRNYCIISNTLIMR